MGCDEGSGSRVCGKEVRDGGGGVEDKEAVEENQHREGPQGHGVIASVGSNLKQGTDAVWLRTT